MGPRGCVSLCPTGTCAVGGGESVTLCGVCTGTRVVSMPWVLTHPSLWLQSVCLSMDPSVPGPKSCSRKECEVQGPFCHFHLACPQAHAASTQPHPLLNLQSADVPPHVRHWPQACLQLQEGEAGAGPAGAGGQCPAVHCPPVTTSRLSPPWLAAPEQGEHTFVGFGGRPASKGAVS